MKTKDLAKNKNTITPIKKTGVIAWMASHSVSANLLMVTFIIGGYICSLSIKKEVFPNFELDIVRVSVTYPGASPDEVEKGIILPVEEAISDLSGVKEVTSNANEGSGSVSIELVEGEDVSRKAQEIKNAVDRIRSFPDEIENPKVSIAARDRHVVTIVIYGDLNEWDLRNVAEHVKDELLQNPDITRVELEGFRNYEISVEISNKVLQSYSLSLNEVAQAIRTHSLDLPGGSIKTQSGEILIRMKERKDWGIEFEKIPIIETKEGNTVYLKEIATVIDDFEESDRYAEFNGKRAINVDVYRVGKQTPINVSNAAKETVESLNHELPKTVKVQILRDRSDIFKGRATLLIKNAVMGLVLVILILGLFLEMRLAFWVMLGIPISFMGAFLFLPIFDVSINVVSMFAFIISLGIVVDDAIVVGENIYQKHQDGLKFKDAAIVGAQEVSKPVTFSILTNIIAFTPLFFVPGYMGKIFKIIPAVIIVIFIISLIESLFILPAHLAHQRDIHPTGFRGKLHNFQQKFGIYFTSFQNNQFASFLKFCLKHRYIAIAIAIAILICAIAYVASGRTRMILMPRTESDRADVNASLPVGSPVEKTLALMKKIVKAGEETAEQICKEKGTKLENLIQGYYASVGDGGSENLSITVYLQEPHIRPVSTSEFNRQWRSNLRDLSGVDNISFVSDRGGPGSGANLTVELRHRSVKVLEKASSDLAKQLEQYPSVKDVDDGFKKGKRQLDFTINQLGLSLGIDSRTIANQIRHAFYGAEAIRQLRGKHQVKVMVRLPKSEREAQHNIENLTIKTRDGGEVFLSDVVTIKEGRAFTNILRRNGKRIINVSASTQPQNEAPIILQDLRQDFLPSLLQKYPGLTYSFEGRDADRRESISSLMTGLLLALVVIFAVLAIPLNSYIQPVIIMMAIPFGLVGAIIGHIIMGFDLSIMSMFGIVALSGVVVNDSLILVDFTNKRHSEGFSPYEAITQAGTARFRAIILTTLTTFGGLSPMILETSRQAKFLIPMAISLGFGILFATVITLIIVPCFYMMLADIGIIRKKHGS